METRLPEGFRFHVLPDEGDADVPLPSGRTIPVTIRGENRAWREGYVFGLVAGMLGTVAAAALIMLLVSWLVA